MITISKTARLSALLALAMTGLPAFAMLEEPIEATKEIKATQSEIEAVIILAIIKMCLETSETRTALHNCLASLGGGIKRDASAVLPSIESERNGLKQGIAKCDSKVNNMDSNDPAYRNTKSICDLTREVFQALSDRLDDPKFTADENKN
jgi:hypothetical protein